MRACVSIACASVMLCSIPGVADAQRLFARQDSTVYEIATGGAGFGRASGPLSIPPGCETRDLPPTSRRTWVTAGGRFLAWDRDTSPGGVCLLNTLAGTVRSLDVPGYAAIVAVQEESFALVVAEHIIPGSADRANERLHLLTDPLGAWSTVTLTSLLPPPPLFGSWYWAYDIAEDAGELVVVLSTNFFNRPAPLLTRVSLASGAVVSVTTVGAPLLASQIAASRDGARVVLLCDDWYEHRDGLFLVDSATGAVVTTSAGIVPLGLVGPGTDSMVWDESAGRILVVTYAGGGPGLATATALLDAATFAVVATIDAPRARLPLRAGYEVQWVRFTLLADPATHTAFLVENEGQAYRYSATENLRTVIHAVDTRTGVERGAVDLAAWYGTAAYALESQAFLMPTLAAPVAPTSRITGNSVELAWSPVATATHYVLEAGSGPGLANYGALNVSGTSFTVSGVPPGRYFVRVRAVGIAGQGVRSADTMVTVP